MKLIEPKNAPSLGPEILDPGAKVGE